MKDPDRKAKKRQARKSAAVSKPERAHREYWLYAIGLLVALGVAFQVYGPALHGPFLFDDTYLPMNVPGFAGRPLSDWIRGVRPLLMFSYWVNFHPPETDTTPYHEWTLYFHFISSILVYLIARKLLQLAGVPRTLALFAAGLFLLHPLQTESVAYIAGRSESLSGMFLLGAFALFLYRRSPAISWLEALGVLALFLAAMETKEHTIVLAGLLLLTDYFWNPGFSLEGIRGNWRLYIPMVAGGAIGAVKVFQLLAGANSAGFHMKELRWYEYLFTQFRVFFEYLRLFLIPTSQSIDYDFPISRSILDHGAIVGLIGILALLGAAVYYRRRYPLACYGFLMFVVLLAPTSSIIPIRDPIAERRLYLPILGLTLIVVDAVWRVRVKPTVLFTALSAVLLIEAALTYRRNIVWSGAIPLWEDTVKKSPGSSRVHFQLAMAYFGANLCQQAEDQFQAVAQLEKPDDRLLLDWALADDCVGKSDDAIAKLRQAAGLHHSAHVYSQLGMMYAKTGRIAEAFQALVMAQNIDRNFEATYVYRGQLFASMNNAAAAEQQYRLALRINPHNPQALAALEQAPGAAMRIGVNALYLIPGKVGGTEIYLRSLLRALAEIDRDNLYFVFLNRETGRDLVPPGENWAAAPLDVFATNRPARIVCEQTELPFEARRLKLDVMFNPGFTAPIFHSCPNVTVIHDLQHKRRPENFRWFDLPFWRILLYAAAHRSRHILTDSEATRDDLIHFYRLPPETVTVAPLGVDPEFFEIARRRRPQPYILAVSTLHPHKGLDELIRAFAEFRAMRPDFRLIVAGLRGFHATALETMRAALHLEEAVRFTGWIPREELYQLFAQASAFFYPSTFEGFGMPVLEALAAGLPTACSDIQPISGIAGDAALLFDPHNQAAIVDAMKRLAGDEALRSSLAARGPVQAARYSWKETARVTLQVVCGAPRNAIS